MKKCENCNKKHDGDYGSGRFCGIKCCKSFSSKVNRKERNLKISKTLKAKSIPSNIRKGTVGYYEWKEKFNKTWEDKRNKQREHYKNNFEFKDWPRSLIIEKIFNEQNGSCRRCENTHWQEELMNLELEHIDGDNRNNKRENLELLCPNCHSMTDTWRGRNKKCHSNRGRVSDGDLLKALRDNSSIRQALIAVELSPKGNNYLRCKKLLGQIKE